jgi:monomeric isocitrate dehydrogenase
MFALNKETAIIVAVIVALFASFYLFKENKKTKDELASFKTLLNKPQPQPIQTPNIVVAAPAPRAKVKKAPEPEPEQEIED